MNRTEYANAVRDLLALEVDERALLPADDTDVHGFDNNAEVLTISPALFERYLSASRKIARQALGHPTGRAVEAYRLPKLLVHDDRMSEALPFGSSGGTAIEHYFPVDGEYRLAVRLSRNNYNYIHGLSEPRDLEVRLNRALVKVFTVGRRDLPAAAEGWAGTLDGPPEWEEYGRAADADFNVRFEAQAGLQRVGVSFVRKTWEPDGVLQPRQAGWTHQSNELFDGHPGVDTVTIEGPLNAAGPGETASRSRILTCQPTSVGDESCARTILSTLARRAYRRPATTGDVDTLMEFYRRGRDKGDFETGIEVALVRLLVSPDFLFRVERDPIDAPRATVYRLTDVELASRLSFFLWSSVPDDELLDVATRGQLSDPTMLDQQVRRMIADPRSSVLVNDFVDQWLQVRNIRDVRPNVELFPEFDENLRTSLQRETELFVESQLRDDRSVVDLLNADYTYVDEPTGAALRDRGRVRRSLPAGVARRLAAWRSARARECPDGNVLFRPHVTGAAGQVAPRYDFGRAPARAATGRAGASHTRRRRQARLGAHAVGGPIARTPCAPPAMPSSTRWASPWRTSTRSARIARPMPAPRSTPQAPFRVAGNSRDWMG